MDKRLFSTLFLLLFTACFFSQVISITFLVDHKPLEVYQTYTQSSCNINRCTQSTKSITRHFFEYRTCLLSHDVLPIFKDQCLSLEKLEVNGLSLNGLYNRYNLPHSRRYDVSYVNNNRIITVTSFTFTYEFGRQNVRVEDYYSFWIMACIKRYQEYEKSERLVVDRIYRTRDDPSSRLDISKLDYEVVIAMSQPLFWDHYYATNLESDYTGQNTYTVVPNSKFVFTAEIDYGMIHKLFKNETEKGNLISILDNLGKVESEGKYVTTERFPQYSTVSYKYSTERPFRGLLTNNYQLSQYLDFDSGRSLFAVSGILGFISSLISIFSFPFTLSSLFSRSPSGQGTISLSQMIDEVNLRLLEVSYCDEMGEYFDAVATLGILYEQARIRAYGSNDIEVKHATFLENKRFSKIENWNSYVSESYGGTSLILFGKVHPKYLEYKLDIIEKAYGVAGNAVDDLVKAYSIRNSLLNRGFYELKETVFSVLGVYGYDSYKKTFDMAKNGDISFSKC